MICSYNICGQELVDSTFHKPLRKKAVKIEFLAPLTGNFTIGYEHYIKNGISWEAKIGMIGAGVNIANQKGIFVKGGPKFKLKPDYIIDGMRSSHPLRGSYIKPELLISYFNHDPLFLDVNDSSNSKDKVGSAILINFGKQNVLAERFTIDWSLGLGYGFTADNSGGYLYGALGGNNQFPIIFSAGFTLGVLLK